MSSKFVSFSTVKLRIAKEPFGIGTRIALEVSLPSREGIAFVTALPRGSVAK